MQAIDIAEIGSFTNLVATQTIRPSAIGNIGSHDDGGGEFTSGCVLGRAARWVGLTCRNSQCGDIRTGGQQRYRGLVEV